jgi:hypothetical protein
MRPSPFCSHGTTARPRVALAILGADYEKNYHDWENQWTRVVASTAVLDAFQHSQQTRSAEASSSLTSSARSSGSSVASSSWRTEKHDFPNHCA